MIQEKYKKYIGICLSVIVGITFLFSAWAKLPTMEQFGWTIVETTFFNWTISEWLVRLLIGLEFTLGLAFIAQLNLKKVIIPTAISLLVIFNIYLVLIWLQFGNSGNCGCFGELLPMTPFESILKNLAMIIAILFIWKIGTQIIFKYSSLVLGTLFIILSLFTVWKLPPESIYLTEKEAIINKPIPLSILYNSQKNIAPKIDLRKGKHIISFMSLTCSFCRKAAKRMRIMKEKYPLLPFYIILNGESEDVQNFFTDTKAQNIDYTLFNGVDEFVKMNGDYSLPSIKWINDTTIIRESNYLSLDENEILEWIKNRYKN